jgi:hypothetical protein
MAETPVYSGALATVAKVIGQFDLVINRGREQGVREGAKFLVYGVGEEIVDPETNESLGNLELVRGIGVVTHVQEKISTITSAITKAPAPIIRTTKIESRGVRGALALLGNGNEVVEERKGDATPVPFSGAKIGDRARPL